MLPYVTGIRKSKMAAAKPEVLMSQTVDKISTKFSVFEAHQNNGFTVNTRRLNSKMAVMKLEVLKSQAAYEISTKFQLIHFSFRGPLPAGTMVKLEYLTV